MITLRVFTDENGSYGNMVGIVLDTKNTVGGVERQKITRDSGFSEVVFVNNLELRSISIYTPQNEIPFAGHAVVGVAYFLNQRCNAPITELMGMGGKIETWRENGLTWVKCDSSNLPPWKYEQLSDPSMVDALTVSEMSGKEHVVLWAWIDEPGGIVRARTFATDWDIPEDEANGSGAMKLAINVGRELTIQHGKGSVIHARPSSSIGCAEVGGMVVIKDEVR